LSLSPKSLDGSVESEGDREREKGLGRALVLKKDAQTREEQLRLLRRSLEREEEERDRDREDAPFLERVSETENEIERDREEDIEELGGERESTAWSRTYDSLNVLLGQPIRLVFKYTLPALHPTPPPSLPLSPTQSSHDCENPMPPSLPLSSTLSNGSLSPSNPNYVPLSRALSILALSVLCISLLASAIVVISESFISRLGIGTATMGATLVALGSEVSLFLFLLHFVFVYFNKFLRTSLSLSLTHSLSRSQTPSVQ
jgi:Ca2+/Na+ antiporter